MTLESDQLKITQPSRETPQMEREATVCTQCCANMRNQLIFATCTLGDGCTNFCVRAVRSDKNLSVPKQKTMTLKDLKKKYERQVCPHGLNPETGD
ncbi:hypothetical protein Tco_1104686 [Tanacetum coccineum]